MIARQLTVAIVCGWIGFAGLLHTESSPASSIQLRSDAKHKSKLKMCKRTKSKKIKQWCKSEGYT